MNLKNMLKRITSNYIKDRKSNNHKLFSTVSASVEELKEVFEKVESWQGIENAEGETLDMIGEDVRQKRLGLTDEEYRPKLRYRISLNKSGTDINSVNTALRSIIGNNFMRMDEGYEQEKYSEPASIVVEVSNYEKAINYTEIDNILAAGVRIYFKAERQVQSKIYFASVSISGEDITIYPFVKSKSVTNHKLCIASAYNTSSEEVNIYPKRF